MAAPTYASHPRLLGDVGGTRARFGWIERAGAALSHVEDLACDDHASLESAIAHYLAAQGRPRAAACALGIASPVTGDSVALTNRPWRFSASQLQRRFGFGRVLLLNDFAALAWGLPGLGAGDVMQVGGGTAVPGEALALVGPGTGLGVSGLLQTGGGAVPVVGEGGHASLAADDADEDRIVALLRAELGHVSAERVLSGDGLVNLHRAICMLGGRRAERLDAAEIVQRALADADLDSRRAVDRFLGWLGSFAGNLALTLGARGGVYVAGGIVTRLGERLAGSPFRERFEAKGRFRDYLAAIPTFVLRDPTRAALTGADRALDGGSAMADVGSDVF